MGRQSKNIALSLFTFSLIGIPTFKHVMATDEGAVPTVVEVQKSPDHQVVIPVVTITPEQRAYEEAKTKYLAEIQVQGLCVEWAQTALDAGWQPEELPRLLRIMFRESRCDPFACGETDSPHYRKCRDWGLMQINDYSWKRIIRSQGYKIEDMWDPYSNLKFARWLFEYSLDRNGDGWQPWKKISK